MEQPAREQPADDVEKPAHEQPADDVEQPAREQPADDVEQPAREQPADDVEQPAREQPADGMEQQADVHVCRSRKRAREPTGESSARIVTRSRGDVLPFSKAIRCVDLTLNVNCTYFDASPCFRRCMILRAHAWSRFRAGFSDAHAPGQLVCAVR